MSEVLTPTRVGVEELVAKLRALPASAFDGTEKIRALLAKMPISEASLAPYLTWSRQHYTRNLIDKTDLYELMAICWEVGQYSSVHNHRDQNCWMAAPVGKLLVENFHVGFQDIEAGKCQLQASNTVESLRCRSAATGAPGGESPRSQSARGDAAHLFAAF